MMPYDGADEAVALARRGKGSLVASVFTNDPDVAEEVVIGLAPFHGRVLIGNRASAKSFHRSRLAARGSGAWRSRPCRRRRGDWAACAG